MIMIMKLLLMMMMTMMVVMMMMTIMMKVTWEDERIWWRKDNITNPGENFTFEPSILR